MSVRWDLPLRKVMLQQIQVLLHHHDGIHLCVPLALPDSIEDLHLLPLCLGIHVPFNLGTFSFLYNVLQCSMPSAKRYP